MTIGVVLPDLTNPLFPPMVRGIEDALSPAGFTALIANTDNDIARARSVVQTLRLRQVDGWISAVATRDDMFEEHVAPLVLLNRQDEVGTPAVVGDDRDGIAQAVAHLVELGHTRIACVAGPQTISTGVEPLQRLPRGDARARLGASTAELVRFADSWSERAGAVATRELLEGGGEFTAVLAGNDMTALGCYETLGERGLSVPGDVSVVGFNDMHFADRFDPPLTTVRIPHHEMGLRAAELLLARIAGGDDESSHVVLPAELVVRRSTRAPNGR